MLPTTRKEKSITSRVDCYGGFSGYYKEKLDGRDTKCFCLNIVLSEKIIATTDISLVKEYNLPEPSQSFIQKYIEEYNRGNIITDVLVEYEIKSNAGLGHNEWVYLQHIEGKRYVPIKIEANNQDIYQLGKEDTFEDYELECNLKVNLTDNTITIKKAKDSYSREEVDRMLDEQASKTTAEMMEKFKDYKSREEIKSLLFKFTNHFDLKRNIEITLDMQSKWLEENL